MEPTKDARLKSQIMRYFIINQEGFGTEIAEAMYHTHEDIFKDLKSLEILKYIQHAKGRKLSARKRNYWRISQDIHVLKRIYSDPDFRDLQLEMRIQPWIAKIATNKIQDYHSDVVMLVSEMITTSPSFFEVMMSHETFDQMKERYRPYFLFGIFAVSEDANLVNYWFLYQLCSECCVKDKEEGNPTDKSDEILGRMAQTLKLMAPVARQEEYIRKLESVIYGIELILPYLDESYNRLKLSLEGYIAEFHKECKEARKYPEAKPESAYYTTLFHVIIRELIDEKEGNPLDY